MASEVEVGRSGKVIGVVRKKQTALLNVLESGDIDSPHAATFAVRVAEKRQADGVPVSIRLNDVVEVVGKSLEWTPGSYVYGTYLPLIEGPH